MTAALKNPRRRQRKRKNASVAAAKEVIVDAAVTSVLSEELGQSTQGFSWWKRYFYVLLTGFGKSSA